METPSKRNAIMDALFGERLTGDDLASHLAARPPRWARYTKMSLYLLVVVLMAASYLNVTDRLSGFGAWLVRERLLIASGCLAIIIALDWYYKRRAEAGSKR